MKSFFNTNHKIKLLLFFLIAGATAVKAQSNEGIKFEKCLTGAQAKEKVIEYSENLNGPGNADQVIMGNQVWMNGCLRIQDCLNGRLNAVVFKGGVPYLTGAVANFNGHLPMLVILDGVQLEPTDVSSTISNLIPTDIQSIEVLKNIAYTVLYGVQGAGGVLIFTTKQGNPTEPYQQYAPSLISYHLLVSICNP